MKIHLKTKYGHFKNAVVRMGYYPFDHKQPMLHFQDTTEGPILTASVCMETNLLKPGQIYIKTWEENEGIVPVLIAAGLISPPDSYQMIGFFEAAICNLTDTAKGLLP